MEVNLEVGNEVFYLSCLILSSSLQGLILSNALRAQKSAKDEGCTISLNNLCSCDTPGVSFVLRREIYPNLGCSVKISIFSLVYVSDYPNFSFTSHQIRS
jgi:hypothetical protein